MWFQLRRYSLPLTVVLFVAASLGLILAQKKDKPQGIHQTVPPHEFQEKLKTSKGKVLDVRTPQEFEQGHLAGAVNINFYGDDFQDRLKALPKETEYFIYCRSGGRSGKTLQIMKDLGFQVVYDMGGGFMGWQKEGLPVASDEKP